MTRLSITTLFAILSLCLLTGGCSDLEEINQAVAQKRLPGIAHEIEIAPLRASVPVATPDPDSSVERFYAILQHCSMSTPCVDKMQSNLACSPHANGACAH